MAAAPSQAEEPRGTGRQFRRGSAVVTETGNDPFEVLQTGAGGSDSNRRPAVLRNRIGQYLHSARSSIASILCVIRTARTDDLGSLRGIERSAGEAFRCIGMAAVADDEPASIEGLAVYQQESRAWVATDEDDRPVAYILARIVDSNAHIEQVSVHPNHARQGIGADLIQTVAAWAEQQGLAAITLSSFWEVPWNGPYYQRLGFERVPERELTEGLRRIRDHEAARGLAQWPRVIMRRPLTD
jgi:GNAT superfamily N-acetyltransferase